MSFVGYPGSFPMQHHNQSANVRDDVPHLHDDNHGDNQPSADRQHTPDDVSNFRNGSTASDIEFVEGPARRIIHVRDDTPSDGAPRTNRGRSVVPRADSAFGNVEIVDAPSADRPPSPVVVVPSGARLRSNVTFSNVRGSYDRVSAGSQYTAGVVGHDRVLVPKTLVRFLENPDSIALLVVSPGPDGAYRPSTALMHQKLRFLFKAAVDWYLKEKGYAGREVHGTFVRTEDERLIPDLTRMRVLGDGYDFYAPVSESFPPTAGAIVLYLSLLAGFLLIALLYYTLVKTSVISHTVTRTTQCPLRTIPYAVQNVQQQFGVGVLRALGRGVLLVDATLAHVRRLAEL